LGGGHTRDDTGLPRGRARLLGAGLVRARTGAHTNARASDRPMRYNV